MQVRLCEVVSDVEHINIEEIIKVLDNQKPFKDYAYILHDKDTYSEADEAKNPDHKAGSQKRLIIISQLGWIMVLIPNILLTG